MSGTPHFKIHTPLSLYLVLNALDIPDEVLKCLTDKLHRKSDKLPNVIPS